MFHVEHGLILLQKKNKVFHVEHFIYSFLESSTWNKLIKLILESALNCFWRIIK